MPQPLAGTAYGTPAPTRPGDPDLIDQADQLDQADQVAGVAILAWRDSGGQVAAAPVADGVQLGGQSAA
jgi:hypothetical protein